MKGASLTVSFFYQDKETATRFVEKLRFCLPHGDRMLAEVVMRGLNAVLGDGEVTANCVGRSLFLDSEDRDCAHFVLLANAYLSWTAELPFEECVKISIDKDRLLHEATEDELHAGEARLRHAQKLLDSTPPNQEE